MKQTRRIVIKNKIFSHEDLARIGKLLIKQQNLTPKSDNTFTSFQIDFSDSTSIESDNLDLLEEDFVKGPRRPVQLRFSFLNYTLHRRIEFSITHTHGENEFGNVAIISGEDQTWVSENYLAMKEVIESVKPQTFWFRKHSTLMLHLIALGIGSLGQFIIDFLITTFMSQKGLENIIKPLDPKSSGLLFLQMISPILYVFLWIWRWILGLMWGAFGLRNWVLSLWPNIEFGFGTDHLDTEKIQRSRIILVFSIIIFPVITSIIYDVLKFLM